MRLKWIREGVEDYEYIQMLRERGEGDFALEQVHKVARNMGDWEPDPAVLYAARRTMGERLDKSGGFRLYLPMLKRKRSS